MSEDLDRIMPGLLATQYAPAYGSDRRIRTLHREGCGRIRNSRTAAPVREYQAAVMSKCPTCKPSLEER